jgi:hypothetical protein
MLLGTNIINYIGMVDTKFANSIAQSQSTVLDSSSNYYSLFKFSIRSEVTRKYYERIRYFLDFIKFEVDEAIMEYRCNSFAHKANSELRWVMEHIIKFLQFQKARVENRDITAATLRNYIKSLKSFCDICEITIPWKKITRGLPRGRQSSTDRAPTIEEIHKLLDYPDRRIKPIIFTMVSSGIRLGAWDLLQWGNVEPILNKNGSIEAAKLLVYAGDVEEYYAFITPEAYGSLKAWMDFRESYGEKVTGKSWLMRDLWQTTNMSYGARWGLATNAKRLKSSGVKRLLERAIWEQDLRRPLKDGEKRHEWKAAHGFRKYYKTHAEQLMRPINVEITMGHDIGVSSSYYKPTEREVLEDYLKAVPLLTINGDNLVFRNQIEELKEKSTDSELVIGARLREKDNQIQTLITRQEKFERLIQSLIDSGQLKPAYSSTT